MQVIVITEFNERQDINASIKYFSGCITSAEAVLIQDQSSDKFRDILRDGIATVVVTISTQCRASLANLLHLSSRDSFLKMCTWLKIIGVKYVFDASAAADACLMEARQEFCERY